MSKISTYPIKTAAALTDKFIGSDSAASEETKQISVEAILYALGSLDEYVDNAAALAGGLVIGNPYKTPTGEIRVVI